MTGEIEIRRSFATYINAALCLFAIWLYTDTGKLKEGGGRSACAATVLAKQTLDHVNNRGRDRVAVRARRSRLPLPVTSSSSHRILRAYPDLSDIMNLETLLPDLSRHPHILLAAGTIVDPYRTRNAKVVWMQRSSEVLSSKWVCQISERLPTTSLCFQLFVS